MAEIGATHEEKEEKQERVWCEGNEQERLSIRHIRKTKPTIACVAESQAGSWPKTVI